MAHSRSFIVLLVPTLLFSLLLRFPNVSAAGGIKHPVQDYLQSLRGQQEKEGKGVDKSVSHFAALGSMNPYWGSNVPHILVLSRLDSREMSALDEDKYEDDDDNNINLDDISYDDECCTNCHNLQGASSARFMKVYSPRCIEEKLNRVIENLRQEAADSAKVKKSLENNERQASGDVDDCGSPSLASAARVNINDVVFLYGDARLFSNMLHYYGGTIL